MTDPPNHYPQSNSPPEQPLEDLSTSDLVSIWQHFADIGGSDKDRAIAVFSILLPIIVAATGFAAKSLLSALKQSIDPELLLQAGIVATVAMIISIIAALITLMYAGYANWNWSKADKIAQGFLLRDQATLKHRVKPYHDYQAAVDTGAKALQEALTPFKGFTPPNHQSSCTGLKYFLNLLFTVEQQKIRNLADRLSKPTHPDRELAPIFVLLYRFPQTFAWINGLLLIATVLLALIH
jgi:hypothetical protein